MWTEPIIIVNGKRLTDAQAMAVRVAVTSFHSETASRGELGEIADAYHARLSEVISEMVR